MVWEHFNQYDDSLETMDARKQFNLGMHQYTDIHEDLNKSTSQRVRAAMFPETMNDAYAKSVMLDSSSAVQHLSKPSQMLKLAVMDLVNYKDDADAVMNALPEIIPLLTDQDSSIVRRAAILVEQLSRKDASRRVMAESQQLVAALLQAIDTTSDPETLTLLMGALARISKVPAGLVHIFRCRAIPLLVKLLGTSIEKIVFYSISTLHQLLLYQEGAKQEVNQCGGLQKMVSLLPRNNVKFLAVTTDCIQMLAYGNQESKLILLASGGPAYLVAIMANYSYEKLLWTTSRVLKIISICSSNKSAIIETGGVQVLASLLTHQSPRLVHNCLWIIRNLSDQATDIAGVSQLLELCVRFLGTSEVDLVACSSGILSNLTCNNADNKAVTCRAGGVEALVHCLVQLPDRLDVVEPTICALRHLSSSHPYAEGARNAIRLQYGLPTIVQLLRPPSYWPLMKASIGLIRNLALSADNQPALRELGALQNIEQILLLAHQELQANNLADDNHVVIDGVSANEMVETCVGAMHILARDSLNRQIIISAGLIPLFVQLLYSSSEGMQRVSSGVLCELSMEARVCQLIEKEGAVATLTQHLHSHNEAVATYSAVVLFRMSEDKSEEYKQRLSIELTNSLARNIPNGHHSSVEDMMNDEPYRGYNTSYSDQKPIIGSYAGSISDVAYLPSDRGHNMTFHSGHTVSPVGPHNMSRGSNMGHGSQRPTDQILLQDVRYAAAPRQVEMDPRLLSFNLSQQNACYDSGV